MEVSWIFDCIDRTNQLAPRQGPGTTASRSTESAGLLIVGNLYCLLDLSS